MKNAPYVLILLVSSALFPATIAGAGAATAEAARGHYDLANSLARLGRHEEAIYEYERAAALEPETPVGRFAREALDGYRRASEKSRFSQTIRKQSEELKARSARDAQGEIRVSARAAETQLDRVEQQKNAAVDDIYANPSVADLIVPVAPFGVHASRYGFGYRGGIGYFRPGLAVVRTVDPVATQARVDDVKERAELKKKKVLAQSFEKAEEIRDRQLERDRILGQTAENLESQLSPGGSVRLNPRGTNLYVRSYR